MSYYSIPEFFEQAVERNARKLWLFSGDEELTYEQASDRIGGVAGALAGRGIGRGDLVLATARNDWRYLLTWLAVVRLGAILVPVNPRSTKVELDGFCTQVEPRAIVSDGDLVAELAHQDPPAGLLDVDRILAEAAESEPPPPAARESDPAVLIPTSGTTGRSKLVTQTHRAYTMAGEGFPYWMQLGPEDRLMTSLPLFHINCPAYSVMGSVGAGASVVLLPRFSASGFLDSARRYGATEFNTIGAMLEILMGQPERDDDADNPLRRCYTGPSPTEARQLEIERRFGIEIVCGYGLSESTYGFVWSRRERPFGTLGKPRQHPRLGRVNEARVVEDGAELGPGEVGELQLRNPAVMLGYWMMPEEDAAVMTEDGWLRTGDLVSRDSDDTYTFVGRRKEVIRRRGENLSPMEVEAAISEHRGVKEVAVIGVPSELTEEEVKAFVVLDDGERPEPQEIREFAAARLSAFKVPRYIEVLDGLPHTPTGRVVKGRLAAELTGNEWDAEAAEIGGERGAADAEWIRSGIGHATASTITVCGMDLAEELMGEMTFPDLAFMLVSGKPPTPEQSRLFNAVLVSLTDHGLTPTALAARLTYTGAPESIQGAIAAGLLGGGSVFLGPTEDTARFLSELVEGAGLTAESTDEELRAAVEGAVPARLEEGLRVPGLGHPVHKEADPRVARLLQIATDGDLLGPHLRLLPFLASVAADHSGRRLPINGAGAAGAALADLGLPIDMIRGFSLLARTAGLVGHLAEEKRRPLGSKLYREIDTRMIYEP